ncbi:MAG: hypothetical protein A2X42_04665 [Candidatus Margulisbacteria bacterium GWF2_38_17]|nr:MAG: hypothetical protein A2X43_04500 [Candidatus Margulisbacteria bacterium GWD2_39_127]OGI04122.1 MAG: hypothetical protein A2X42_04665 [Candidatus Margulisbacteria bacterium GWF2_38_17]OGI05973.1 MAG: hypothetical protein A2X41_12175 [Candidatus Margulisbacteria bacterium GWE2_39_32]
MKLFFENHFKLLFFIVIFAVVFLVFRHVLPIILFALSIAIVVEPIYISLLKTVQKKNYSTGLWSQIILILFLVCVTLLVATIVVLPCYYLQKNINLLIQFTTKALEVIEENATRFYVPVQTIRNMGSGIGDYLFSMSAMFVRSIPEHFTTILIFYITLFSSIKYFRVLKRDISSLVPLKWNKVLGHLYSRTYLVLRAFYVVHLLIALLVFVLSMLVYRILSVPDILFFGLITAILQLVPFIGAATMMIGMSIYYLLIGDIIKLLVVLFIGYPLLVIIPEMVIRPWLMGRGARISMTLILLGVLVGIKTMGLIGLVFGPVLLVLCQEIFIIAKERYGERELMS